MTKFLKVLTAALIALFAIGSLSACSTSEPLDMSTIAAVVDVRTPGEFAEGHLDGALNIDWQGANFAAEISNLDPAADYVIYCRSGNRAGQAISFMQSNGFTGTLTNGGGLADASSLTGIAVVQ
jgi:rhodanese-related sulfurtransferase